MSKCLGVSIWITIVLILAPTGWVLYPVLFPVTISQEVSTNLYLNWIYTATFSGDILAAEQYARNYGLSIQLQPGGESRDPIKLVGDNNFGIASADEIIRAVDKGADVRIIGVLQDEHPAAFVALATSGIAHPKDFEGKRVGLLPFGATGLIYTAMCQNAGVDRTKITEVVISPDVRPFMAGKVNDVQPIFVYDEPVTFDEHGIKYTIIDPREYGVHFKGQAYFTTSATVRDNPDLVRSFLSAVIDGWSQVSSDPQSGIAALRRIAPTMDARREKEMLRRGLKFFVPPQREILMTDLETWTDMFRTLRETKTVENDINVDSLFALDPLKQIYASRKK